MAFFAWQTELLNAEYEKSVEALGMKARNPLMLARCGPSAILPETLVRSFVQLVTKTIEKSASSTSQEALKKLLGRTSVIPKLKLTQVTNVVGDVMSFYATVLSLKSPSLLEEAYTHIVGELQIAYNTLLEKTLEKNIELVNVLTDNPHHDWKLEIHEAQVCVFESVKPWVCVILWFTFSMNNSCKESSL